MKDANELQALNLTIAIIERDIAGIPTQYADGRLNEGNLNRRRKLLNTLDNLKEIRSQYHSGGFVPEEHNATP